MRPRSLLPMGDLEKYPITFNPQPSIAGEPILPQVNRSNLRNHLCFSTLLQVSRYTCGRPSTGNVPQKALSLWYALHPPPQVNRALLHNLQITSTFQQTSRYTCGSRTVTDMQRGVRQKTEFHSAHYSAYSRRCGCGRWNECGPEGGVERGSWMASRGG